MAHAHRLLAERGGGVLVTASSVAGVFGGASIASYAAASACQEAFAEQHAGRGSVRHHCFMWSTSEDTGLSRGYRRICRARAGTCRCRPAGRWSVLLAGAAAGEGPLVVGLDADHRQVRRHLDTVASDVVEMFYEGAPAAADDAEAGSGVRDGFGRPVPRSSARVAALPRLASGVVDRAQLAMSGHDAVRRERRGPRSDTEPALAALWRQVLNVTDVGLDDDFFDCGGDSLTALRLAARCRRRSAWSCQPASSSTRRASPILARAVDAAGPGAARTEAAGASTGAPMSEGQRALWFLHQLDTRERGAQRRFTARVRGPNDAGLSRWRGRRSPIAIPRCARSFPQPTARPCATCSRPSRCRLPSSTWTVSVTTRSWRPSRRKSIGRSRSPRPGFRVRLIRRDEHDAVLTATFHHIAIDGGALWSCLSELGVLYHASAPSRHRRRG